MLRKPMLFIPSCPQVRDNMTEYLEGTLPFHTRMGIRLHLMMCRACNALRNVLMALPSLSKQALEAPASPAPEAQDAFAAAMAKIKATRHDGPGCGCHKP